MNESLQPEFRDTWRGPPRVFSLEMGDVHVWRADLTSRTLSREHLLRSLSSDERLRASRFRFLKDRDHFVAARGALRSILGRYIGIEASRLQFVYGPHGKPRLAGAVGGHRIEFNLAHSNGLGLVAVALSRPLGVDLERIRPDVAGEEIAERFFAPAEVRALRGLPQAKQDLAFFRCWTRKEAYIKARGEGLSMPLSRFCVSLSPGESPALLRVEGDPAEISRWSFRELAPGPGYVAALAVEGRIARLERWELEEG